MALPTVEEVVPRPRLKNKEKNTSPAPIDLRMKAIVLLSELAAMRRGEIRALRWRCVDLEKKLISIEENYTDADGFKAPKRESSGVVPMTSELETSAEGPSQEGLQPRLGLAGGPRDLQREAEGAHCRRDDEARLQAGARPHRHRGRR